MASFLSKWMGTPWALFIAALLVVIGLMAFGVDRTNIAISRRLERACDGNSSRWTYLDVRQRVAGQTREVQELEHLPRRLDDQVLPAAEV